jgi:hypothetical protein
VHAQDESFRFGIKAAPNLGFIHPDTKELKNDGSRLGFTFGLMGDFLFGSNNRNYAFSTGLYLNSVGGKTTYPSPLGGTNLGTETKLQYIELPLTLKLMTNEIGYITYYGQIGFGTAFNIAAKSDFDSFDANGQDRADHRRGRDGQHPAVQGLFGGGRGHALQFQWQHRADGGGDVQQRLHQHQQGPIKVGDDELKAKLNYLELSLGVFF